MPCVADPALPRLLLAEGDRYVRRVAEIALRRDGFAVTPVSYGFEALRALHAGAFDVAVLDGAMQGLDGLETCRYIRLDEKTARLPVLILGPWQNLGGKASSAAGVTGYIRKPFNALTLGLQVRRACAPVEA